MKTDRIALALVLALVATYETRYTDASGASCIAFSVSTRELDLCTGSTDRPAPAPPVIETWSVVTILDSSERSVPVQIGLAH